jgi:hypothetical protein
MAEDIIGTTIYITYLLSECDRPLLAPTTLICFLIASPVNNGGRERKKKRAQMKMEKSHKND